MSYEDRSPTATAASEAAGWSTCEKCARRSRIGQQFCEFCGDALPGAAGTEPAPSTRQLSCEQCGASVVVPPEYRTAECPFCGTAHVATGELSPDRYAPEFVVSFSVPRKEARGKFKAWLGERGFFTPKDFGLDRQSADLKGVYLPFWSFSMRSDSNWSASIGEYWWETITETYTTTENGRTVTKTRTRRVRRTEWYPLSGRYHQYHFHYLVSGSRGLPQKLADRIKPFPVAEATRYAPHFLAGWMAEEYSVDREGAERIAMAEFRRREERSVAAFLPGDTHRSLDVSTQFSEREVDLFFVPLWIFAFPYRGKSYRFLVNGATGATFGERPFSSGRLAALVLGIIGLVGVIALTVAALGGAFR